MNEESLNLGKRRVLVTIAIKLLAQDPPTRDLSELTPSIVSWVHGPL